MRKRMRKLNLTEGMLIDAHLQKLGFATDEDGYVVWPSFSGGRPGLRYNCPRVTRELVPLLGPWVTSKHVHGVVEHRYGVLRKPKAEKKEQEPSVPKEATVLDAVDRLNAHARSLGYLHKLIEHLYNGLKEPIPTREALEAKIIALPTARVS